MKLYWSNIGYEYVLHDYSKGGFVYAFVKAFDSRDALDKLMAALKSEENIIVQEVEYISEYTLDLEWESADDQQKYVELYYKAQECDEVVFDSVWEYGAED